MATYTMVIDKLLLSPEKPELQALAWNVFYHMRLHAHPIPDAPLYALMIRACAKGVSQPQDVDVPSSGPKISDAERALDLFREMTTRYSVRPNAEVYNSLILACSRRKDFYLEAFRLLREMVELETERSNLSVEEGREVGLMRFAPDRYTFNALLQGCARNRDLARARWVLAEMIRTTLPLFDGEVRKGLRREEVVELLSKRPDGEVMCHVFHTYASYVPPVKRDQLQVVSGKGSAPTDQSGADGSTSATTDFGEVLPSQPGNTSELEQVKVDEDEGTTPEEAAQIFSSLVPQTSSDLLSEARSLFARILADQPQPSSNSILEGPLGGAKPTIRLVNAYLTVLAAHLPPQHRAHVLHSTLATESEGETGGETLEYGLFKKLGLGANEHSYRIILEALSDSKAADTGKIVDEVWGRFQEFLANTTGAKTPRSNLTDLVNTEISTEERLVDAVQVKKSWCAYIHFLSKNAATPPTTTTTDSNSTTPPSTQEKGEEVGLDKAVSVLRQFTTLYPPTVAPRKSRQARKRAQTSLLARLNDKSLPKVDLSPLPLPIKSLQTLQELSYPSLTSSNGQAHTTKTDVEKEGEDAVEGKQEEGGMIKGMEGRPSLTFLDVQLLHHRLVRYGRTKDLAYLSWVLHRYSAAPR